MKFVTNNLHVIEASSKYLALHAYADKFNCMDNKIYWQGNNPLLCAYPQSKVLISFHSVNSSFGKALMKQREFYRIVE